MQLPANTLQMMRGDGQFDPIKMGGIFTGQKSALIRKQIMAQTLVGMANSKALLPSKLICSKTSFLKLTYLFTNLKTGNVNEEN